jgi:integrase
VHESLIGADPRLALFMRIFYDSGSRVEEMMRVKIKDVELLSQRFKVTILKGAQPVGEIWKPIKDVTLADWSRAIVGGVADDFVFGKGLKPGPVPLSAHAVYKRWRVRIKSKVTGLGIDVGIYSLKYSHSNDLTAILGLGATQAANSHTSATTTRIYADEQAEQELQLMLEKVRKAPDTFAPVATG